MKSIINKIFLLSVLTMSLSACSDFLDKEPLSQGTENIVFKTPEHFKQAANNLYKMEGWKDYNDKATYYKMDQNLDISGLSSNGGNSTPEDNFQWNKPYEHIRGCNILLEKAISLLPVEKNIPDVDKGKVSQEAAKAFLARVLLYEATWEKYAESVSNFDGDGSSVGAGAAKPENYPSITSMLTQSKKLSGEVITEAETGTYQLWNECDSLSYYYLFNIDDKGGNIPNFKGKGKSTNKEFIFSAKYDYDLRRGGINLSHTVAVWGATNISTQFGESFLCRNGLPIRVSYTGNIADAQNNSEFLGYKNFVDEYRNRDYRFVGSTYLPDRTTWSSRSEDGRQLTATGQPYPEPVFPQPSENLNLKDPAYSSKRAVFIPTIRGNSTFSSYGSRKFMIEGAGRSDNTESADYPLIRLAEVHLIYAEATCELNNGSISDADLNFSINKNRARAGVAPLSAGVSPIST